MGRGLGAEERDSLTTAKREHAFVVYTVRYDRERADEAYAGDVVGAPKWIALECVPSLGPDTTAEIERVGETIEGNDLLTVTYTIIAGEHPIDYYVRLIARTLVAHDLVTEVVQTERKQ